MSAPTADTADPLSRAMLAEIPPNPHARLWLALRIVVPLALLAYLTSVVSLPHLLAALRSIPMTSVLAVVALLFLAMGLAAVRWRVVLHACGIHTHVPLLELFRLHWVGAFYNQCVPGGVGGDVVRAVATRRLYGARGLPAALGVVLLERLLGLCGLLVLVSTSFALYPLPGVPNVMLFSAIGIAAIASCIGAILAAPRIAPHLPGPLRRVLEAVPVITSLPLFGVGLLLSVLTQLMGALIGHLVVVSIAPQVTLMQSLVINPLILAAQYVPFTVGGAGVREFAFVTFYGLVAVPQHSSLAAALVIGAVQFLSGAAGGVVQMLRPLEVSTTPD
ncbi:MAG TPA: lysylphosphatidylglycerol synthase transmembrane domain-containing protein [Polyangiales bacterium]|nr:lysylphosphatidylglycerol synthase transmembrane domain-containing protein [Polyangiales bacterium]